MRPQIKKFYKTTPPQKNRNSDSKYNFIVMKRGPKAPRRAQRAPGPSAGAGRRGAECPKLLELYQVNTHFTKHLDKRMYFNSMYFSLLDMLSKCFFML